MEQIVEKHKALTSGMTKIYDLLIAMRYISASDVIRPPNNIQYLASAQLQALGYEPEVLELIEQLPALRSEVTWGFQDWGTELLPRSKAVTYFAHPGDSDFVDDLRWGDFYKTNDSNEMKLLHPWMLKLTECGQYGYGTSLIYNTRDQSIIEWTQMGKTYWDEIPSRPAEQVLSEIARKLETLEWVPYYEPKYRNTDSLFERKLVENPIVFQNIWPGGVRVPEDILAAIEFTRTDYGEDEANRFRQSINNWRALQKHYLDCGWGTEDWDADAFWAKRVSWIHAMNALRSERPKSVWSPETPTEVHPSPLRREWEQRWNDFFTDSAGDRAV